MKTVELTLSDGRTAVVSLDQITVIQRPGAPEGTYAIGFRRETCAGHLAVTAVGAAELLQLGPPLLWLTRGALNLSLVACVYPEKPDGTTAVLLADGLSLVYAAEDARRLRLALKLLADPPARVIRYPETSETRETRPLGENIDPSPVFTGESTLEQVVADHARRRREWGQAGLIHSMPVQPVQYEVLGVAAMSRAEWEDTLDRALATPAEPDWRANSWDGGKSRAALREQHLRQFGPELDRLLEGVWPEAAHWFKHEHTAEWLTDAMWYSCLTQMAKYQKEGGDLAGHLDRLYENFLNPPAVEPIDSSWLDRDNLREVLAAHDAYLHEARVPRPGGPEGAATATVDEIAAALCNGYPVSSSAVAVHVRRLMQLPEADRAEHWRRLRESNEAMYLAVRAEMDGVRGRAANAIVVDDRQDTAEQVEAASALMAQPEWLVVRTAAEGIPYPHCFGRLALMKAAKELDYTGTNAQLIENAKKLPCVSEFDDGFRYHPDKDVQIGFETWHETVVKIELPPAQPGAFTAVARNAWGSAWEATVRVEDANAIIVNDRQDLYAPCPCGSGKRYKWCCHVVAAAAAPAAPDLEILSNPGQLLAVRRAIPRAAELANAGGEFRLSDLAKAFKEVTGGPVGLVAMVRLVRSLTAEVEDLGNNRFRVIGGAPATGDGGGDFRFEIDLDIPSPAIVNPLLPGGKWPTLIGTPKGDNTLRAAWEGDAAALDAADDDKPLTLAWMPGLPSPASPATFVLGGLCESVGNSSAVYDPSIDGPLDSPAEAGDGNVDDVKPDAVV